MRVQTTPPGSTQLFTSICIMALWENDGGAADFINVLTEDIGDGTMMDALRRHFRLTADAHETQLQQDMHGIASRLHKVERRVHEETGLVPDFSVPVILYHQYAADFRFKAAELGITLESNGYECWSCPDFIRWFKKKHPELVHKEAQRNATIIVPGDKYGAARPLATTTTTGGLIAA